MDQDSKGAIRKNAETAGGGERPPILPYLASLLGSLNPTDRLIGETVLSDPERVLTSTIADFAQRAGASVGSVVGFCRRVGLEGFANFKIALAGDLARTGLSHADPDDSLLEQVFAFHAARLVETRRINTEAKFEEAAKALAEGHKIEFFSIGLSYPVAYTAHCKFALLGLPSSAQFDTRMQLIAATQLAPGDVAFGISLSGDSQETVQCLEVAKRAGALTICITNAINSPITEFSDISLFAAPSEVKFFIAPLASRMTQLAIIDALFVVLAHQDKARTADFLQVSGPELLRRRVSP